MGQYTTLFITPSGGMAARRRCVVYIFVFDDMDERSSVYAGRTVSQRSTNRKQRRRHFVPMLVPSPCCLRNPASMHHRRRLRGNREASPVSSASLTL